MAPAPTLPANEDARFEAAWDSYQKAPNDKAAFVHLMRTAAQLGREETLSTLETREIEAANQARHQETMAAVASAINDAVALEAPDVDLELFWTFGRQAQRETPRHLVKPADKIEWQKNRMIQLTRAKTESIVKKHVTSALEAEQIKRDAGAVTSGGRQNPPPAAPKPEGERPSFVDQANKHKARV